MRAPAFPADRLDPARPTGLILCGMGGPDGPQDVEPFLRNLFSDPRIIPIPRWVAPLAARMIARRRGPAVRARYAMIGSGGGSPQLPTTRQQAEALAERAAARDATWLPGVAMRYWRPFPEETVADLRKQGAEQYLVVPMYPQYADATNGSTLDFTLAGIEHRHPGAPVHVLPRWGLLDGFVESLAGSAEAALRTWSDAGVDPAECALLFVAHSLPQRFIDAGDPYLEETRATVTAVHAALRRRLEDRIAWLDGLAGGRAPLLAFQSRVGPIEWLGPEITAETLRLAAEGRRRLHVQPVSFTCEHVETLHELDLELREDVAEAGIAHFTRGAALNLDPVWLDALAAHLLDIAFGGEGAHA